MSWEPAGNRVELANAGARLILAPDWEPVVWTEADRKKGQAWGLKTIETFHTHGTPPVAKNSRQEPRWPRPHWSSRAHSADFVWRCGGAIALHQEHGLRRHRRLPVAMASAAKAPSCGSSRA